jgi:hypothetical protein
MLTGEFAAVLLPLNKFGGGLKPAATYTQVFLRRLIISLLPSRSCVRQHVLCADIGYG